MKHQPAHLKKFCFWLTILICLANAPFCLSRASLAEMTPEVISPEPVRLTLEKGDPTQSIAATILAKAYKNLDIPFTLIDVPFRRALRETNFGMFDGEVARFSVIETMAPNLVRVPEPLFDLTYYAFHSTPLETVMHWHDQPDLKVGLEMGVVMIETKTQGMNRKFGTDLKILMQMLRRGAIDVLIYEDSVDLRLPPYSLTRLPDPVVSAPLYHYLHKSQAALAAPLAAELSRLRQSGEIDALVSSMRAQSPQALQQTAEPAF